jgi:CheY-like chemotaxis protein
MAPLHSSAGVLVVDDSEVFLPLAASVVSGTEALHLAGTATSGEEAIRQLPTLKPDLVLLDINMPRLSGIETAHIIQRKHPKIVVMLVSAEPSGYEAEARSAGAATLPDKRDLRPETLDELWITHRLATPSRQLDPKMTALGKANEIRVARAKLKQRLRRGETSIQRILAAPPKCVSTAPVLNLLLAVPNIGPVRAGRLLTTARLSQSKTIGTLSERQRGHLIDLLRNRTEAQEVNEASTPDRNQASPFPR